MQKILRYIGFVILILGAVSMLLPFIYMLSLSFMTDTQIFSGTVSFLPSPYTGENYKYVVNNADIFRYFFNSMFVAIATTIGQVIISAMAGYAFARYNFKYKEILFFLVIVSMMIPPQVNIIPLFFLMKQFHWIDTYWALIIPGLFGGFGVFMMRQYFYSFAKELEEASKLDGCNIFQTFFKIALPCALPAIATLSIFTFVTTWNSFMWPLIVTNTESMRTLAVGLTIFKSSFREITLWGELMACSCICSIPVIAVFIVGKKYLINNPMDGAVKG